MCFHFLGISPPQNNYAREHATIRHTHLSIPTSHVHSTRHLSSACCDLFAMASATVYDGVRSTDASRTGVFDGQKLWFSRNVPMRKHIMELAESNGAEIVAEEKHADVLLVDHVKKPAAPGTHSYRYVELSVRNGQLEDLADHAVGVADRANRPVGSIATASKGGRTPFTEADDQFLWKWIQPFKEVGGALGGNEIYKQLEKANPRHTFQSWRDRWLKYVSLQKRTASGVQVRVQDDTRHGSGVSAGLDQDKKEALHGGGQRSRLEKRPPDSSFQYIQRSNYSNT